MLKDLEKNQLEKPSELETPHLLLFIQLNTVKSNLLMVMVMVNPSEKLLEFTKVENLCLLNMLRLAQNQSSLLEFQTKILLNKKLELLMEVNLCQFNFLKVNKNLKLAFQINKGLIKK